MLRLFVDQPPPFNKRQFLYQQGNSVNRTKIKKVKSKMLNINPQNVLIKGTAQLAKGDHFIHQQGRGLEEVDRPVSLLGILWRVDRQPLV